MRALTDVGSWRLSRVWRYTILSPMSCHGNCPLSQSSFTLFSPEFHTVNKKLHRCLRGHQCESFFHERCLKLSRWLYLEAECQIISFYNLPGSVYKCIYCCTRVCESWKVNLKTNYINVQKLERRMFFFMYSTTKNVVIVLIALIRHLSCIVTNALSLVTNNLPELSQSVMDTNIN